MVAKTSLFLSLPARLILESISILKTYGLTGFAGLLLRKDFMESAETLKRISGIDKSLLMSLHELTACIYYKLAIDRGLRGCNPDSELIAHQTRLRDGAASYLPPPLGGRNSSGTIDHSDYDDEDFECMPAKDADISTALRLVSRRAIWMA